MTINNVSTWLKKCKESCFGIKLPNGWLGRPFDNHHQLDDYEVNDKMVRLEFDDGRELIIHDCGKIRFETDPENNHLAIFEEFGKVEFSWYPYSGSLDERKTEFFTDGKLVLYGYYFQ